MDKNTSASTTLSLIICTAGHRKSLIDCLRSATFGKNENLQIIVVVQRNQEEFIQEINIQEFMKKNSNITFIFTNTRGLSRARNIGIKNATSKHLFFTDDDCILGKSTIKNILSWIKKQKNKHKIICFGKTLPYEPQKHPVPFVCPCCFEKGVANKNHYMHWVDSGFGNNMLISKELFSIIGMFKEWLGVGSVGVSAEDAEFIIRSKIKEYSISYNQNMLIFHNRWLSKNQMDEQEQNYNVGGIVAYGYHYFQGCLSCRKAFKIHLNLVWHTAITEIRAGGKIIIHNKNNEQTHLIFKHFQKGIVALFEIFRGLTIALYFSIVDSDSEILTKRSG